MLNLNTNETDKNTMLFTKSIEKLPLLLRDRVLELLCLGMIAGEDKNKKYEGVDVRVETKVGTKFLTRFTNVDEDNLLFSDVEGHLRVLRMDCLHAVEIINHSLINQIFKEK